MVELRRRYGAAPWHLLLLLGCFAVAGWIALRLAGEPTAGRMLLWFLGAVVVHDLVLFPAYALVDRALRATLARGRPSTGGPAARRSRRPSALNHVRVPALAAGLVFLVYLPGVLGLGDGTYSAATGLQPRPLLARWLALTGVLFAASAAVYVLRWLRQPGRGAGPAAGGPGPR
ncbi:hypothetical protein E1193_12915 [Micromonospora sp. KC606]|uniref:hypothetical protein n=1 Tax=Micromonospora sp. KC606 TaxID=2530379 RepID=UPI0010431CF8|nr:hypothetical protein [Micromonospora sp. KC606]TDC82093.1 hypothetical protein E1193_12915 [Micromonospora sp. KC606]